MSKVRMRFALALVAAIVVTVFAAPVAVAQSPNDIPGFDQLPLPGGDDPADPDDPASDDPDDGSDGGQVDAPGGGVDTGAGGLANDSDALPVVALGAVAAMGAAVLTVRRRTV